MDSVVWNKNLFLKHWNAKKHDYELLPIKPETGIALHLHEELRIENLTLACFFDLISRLPKSEQEVLSKSSHCPLEPFVEEIKNDTEPDDENEIKWIEVNPMGEIWENDGLSIYFHVSGKDGEGDSYDIGSANLPTIKSLPIKINAELAIYDWTKPLPITTPVLTTKYEPTLLQFIHAILWDISWWGTPKDKDAFLESLGKEEQV